MALSHPKGFVPQPMPKSFTQIQQQIAKLQRQANEVRGREASAVIKRIRTAIEHYELTPQDLFGSATARATQRPLGKRSSAKDSAPHGRAAKPGKAERRPAVAVKFRDDEGNTWTGRGSQPRWLVAHLKSGRKIADFAVEAR
jgi:DNA-binding protein H-NS